MNNHIKRISIYLIAILALIGIDQYVKYLTVKHIKGQESIDVIKNVFQLTYVENRGAAFGMLQNQRIFFLIITVIIVALVFYVLFKVPFTKRFKPMRILIVLFIGGTIGNWLDRLRLTYVIDTFYFSLIDFPVFNVADSLVVVSTLIFTVLGLFYYKESDYDFLRRKAKNENV